MSCGAMNRRNLLIALLIQYLLLLLLVANFYRHLADDISASPPSDLLKPTRVFVRQQQQRLIIEDQVIRRPLPLASESVLFPDWSVFLLLPPSGGLHPTIFTDNNFTCIFTDGSASPAVYSGLLPSSLRPAFLCPMPHSVRRRRPLRTPLLVSASGDPIAAGSGQTSTAMMRWTRLAYESYSTPTDVIVFAKGVNRYQGRDRPPTDVSCVFTVDGSVAAVTNSTSSAQEVFRCPHPPYSALAPSAAADVRVSVKLAGDNSPFPSLTVYRPPPGKTHGGERGLTCACTMVYNAAKFLKEWVAYHAAIGVDRFLFYDNGSDDGLAAVLGELEAEGYDVASVYWPWQKTQEAGFSHCAASQRGACGWAAFIDVDEYIYSPSWSRSKPNGSSLLVDSVMGGGWRGVQDKIITGQVEMACVDFGPSGQRAHPAAGVTQGYTCRAGAEARLQRHKSVVRLEAVGHGLRNSVHHFELGPGWETRRAKGGVRVNHYKYQAWSEFKLKFRRRVSAYVADWKERRNEGSLDRTPGLGFTDAEEPDWWASGRCHVRDTGLRDLLRRWFLQPTGTLPWEPTNTTHSLPIPS